MKPRYSVIMPLYNKEPYIAKALGSVCNQTYSNWELVIINDGSTDNSVSVARAEILKQPKDIQSNIHVIDQTNAGVAAARNNGVAASYGEYVCFLDADDWWEPEYLEEMDKLIRKYPDAGLYASNYIYYKPGKIRVMPDLQTGIINYPKDYVHTGAMPVTSITACMPRKVFDEMGGFPVGIKLGEDFLLWAKTALHYKVAFCEKALAYYNNDIPPALRATCNLHAPQFHMLFNMSEIEQMINGKCTMTNDQSAAWYVLLDWLRVNGLLDYWMDERYHDAAAAELAKVDWSMQPKKVIRLYKTPIWILKRKRDFIRIGSYCKQKLIRIMKK